MEEPSEADVFGDTIEDVEADDELDIFAENIDETTLTPHQLRRRRGFQYSRRPAPVYDWEGLRARYVEGVKDGERTIWPTYDDIAEHFGVSALRIRHKAASEGWTAARTRYKDFLVAERQKAKATEALKAGEDLDTRALNAAQLGVQLCMTRLTEIAEVARANRAREGGKSGVIAREMDTLAKAVDLWHRIGLRSLGDVETSRLEITGANGQPLEISAELRRDNPDRLTGVLAVLQQAGLGEFFSNGPGIIEGETDGGYAEIEAGS